MRHRKKVNHLSRTSPHRKALLANMATSLIIHKGIVTTLAKAKALKTYIEPLINRSKEDSTHNRRLVFSYLNNKNAVSELFRNISIKVAKRHGGYTRILRIANRNGDNAQLCRFELVDYNENMLATKSEIKQKVAGTRRSTTRKKKLPVASQVEGGVITEKTKAVKAHEETPKEEPKEEPIVEQTSKDTELNN